MTLVKTPQQFKEFSNGVKDMVSNVYNYILRNQEESTYIDFTHEGIRIAHDSISCVKASKKWVNVFIANIDQIKKLVDEQPTYLVEITSHIPTHMGDFYKTDKEVDGHYISTHTESFRAYDKNKSITRLNIIRTANYFQSYRISLDGVELDNH